MRETDAAYIALCLSCLPQQAIANSLVDLKYPNAVAPTGIAPESRVATDMFTVTELI